MREHDEPLTQSVEVSELRTRWSRLVDQVVSDHILTELARTFALPYFSRRLSPAHQAANLAIFQHSVRS
jgi:hypothetical protein